MKPIPLFGSSITALNISKVITSQRRLNCWWYIPVDGDKTDAALIGTFGLTLWSNLPTYPIRGWRVVGLWLYVVSGNTLYRVSNSGTYTALGTLSALSGTSKVTLTDNSVQLGVVDGVNLYCYTIVTGSYAQAALNAAGSWGIVTDPNLPKGPTTIDFIDGRNLVEQPNSRQAFVSASYDLTNWTPALYFTKENYPGNLSAVSVLNGLVLLWGFVDIEFWQDVGGAVLPYARIPGSTAAWGLAAKFSRALVNNTVYWLATNPTGSLQVMKLNGYTPTRVSNSDVEAIFEQFSVTSDAVALGYTAFGHGMYQITFPTEMRSFLFDSFTGMWQEVQTGLALTGRHQAELGVTFNAENYVSDYSNGNIYYLDVRNETDNGQAIKRQFTSRHIRDGGNTISISELFLDMETGVGLQSGQGSDPQISVEVSKDNGRTFGGPRLTSLGKVGQYRAPRVYWRGLGRSKDFVFRFTITDPVKMVVTGGAATIGARNDPRGV